MASKVIFALAALILSGCSGQLTDPGYASKGAGSGNSSYAPAVSIASFKTKEYVQGGSIYNFRFTVTDSLGFDSSILEFSKDNGLTWKPMVSATGQSSLTFATASGIEAVFIWTVPKEPDCTVPTLTSDTNQYLIRVTSSGRPDAPITVKKAIVPFTVDSCAPIFSVDQFAMTTQDKGFINFTISNLTDPYNLSPIKAVCIKANFATAPLVSDSCWRSLVALRVPQSATPGTITVNYFAGFTVATFNFYVWAVDMAGNISTMKTDTGSLTTDTKGTDFIENISRSCVPASSCTLAIAQSLTANTSTIGSGLVTKSGSPSASSINVVSDPKYFVVTANGTFIYRDGTTNSIKKINFLTDTVAVTLIANGAAPTSGDQTAARVYKPSRLALDFDENLYILDFDRIQKVTFTSDTVFNMQTVAGGGTDVTSAFLQNPLSLQISPYDRTTASGASQYWYGSFEVTQGGEIYFAAADPQLILDTTMATHHKLKLYSPKQTNQISTLEFSGVGIRADSTVDTKNLVPFGNFGLIYDSIFANVTTLTTRLCEAVATCASQNSAGFGKNDGVSLGASLHPAVPSQWSNGAYFNSKKGDLYHLNSYAAYVAKLNPVSFNWVQVVGNGIYPAGFCADSTSATSCAVRLWDSYVGHNEQMYFIDFGRLRVVDLDGKVKTIVQ